MYTNLLESNLKTWVSEGGAGGATSLWILKILAKKVVFLVLSGKKISPLLTPAGKIFEKSPSDPLKKILPTPVHEDHRG